MFERIHSIIVGLIDGTTPLPPPFPQNLNFTKRRYAARDIARFVSRHLEYERFVLSDDELRHLLYKIASHITRVGAGRNPILHLSRILPAIFLTMRTNPEWLTSKAGVPWAIENAENWARALQNQRRGEANAPEKVADLEWYPGFYLVELTNGAHVHAEGVAMGHCMSWSINRDAIQKHGRPAPNSAEAMECLTYAVKIRHRQLRIFSLRGPDDTPVSTIAYSVAGRYIEEIRGTTPMHNSSSWSLTNCALLRALSSVVEIDLSQSTNWRGCLRRCPGDGWCEGKMPPDVDILQPPAACEARHLS